MPAYVTLPGTSGNYFSTPDVNLLDADTGNLYQSVGKWTRYFSVNNTHVDDTSFYSGKGQKILATGVSAASVRTNASSRISVSSSTEYEFQVRLIAETACRVAIIIGGYTAANAFVGNITVGSDIDLTAGQDYVYTISGTTQPTTALLDVNIQLYESGGAQALSGTGFTMGDCQLATTLSLDFLPSLRIVNDLECEWKVALDDYTPAATNTILDCLNSNDGYRIRHTTGDLIEVAYGNGSSTRAQTSSATGLTDGDAHVFKVTVDQSTGAVVYYIDGVQHDTDTMTTGAGSVNINDLVVGANAAASANWTDGDIYYVIVRDGIDGPIVAKFDADDWVGV